MRRFVNALLLLSVASPLAAQTSYELAYRYRDADRVEAVGDVNKDGHPDLLVGSGVKDYAALISGKDFKPIKIWNAPTKRTGFGSNLLVGDFDQDKVPDYLVAAPNAQSGKGAVYVISGKSQAITMQIIGDGGGFGLSMCLADLDLFPDGKKELIVGAPYKDLSARFSAEGEIRLFRYKNGVGQYIRAFGGNGLRANFGTAMHSQGDLDGNPGEDVVITAKGYYSSISGCGGGYFDILSGGTISLTRTQGEKRTCFGSSVLIDDFDKDGKKEIFVGCGFNNRVSIAYLYEKNSTGAWINSVTFRPKSGTRNFGRSVCVVPDLNSDGVRDLAIAGSDAVEFWAGRSWLPIEHFKWTGNQDIAYVGDLDKDGVFEILTGSNDGYPVWNTSLSVWSKKRWVFRPRDNYVSATRGGRIPMDLRLGTKYAGQLYMVLGSLSGTSPGIPLPGAGTLPLNFDPFMNFMLGALNNAPFLNFVGFVKPDGTAQAIWQSAGNLGAFAPLRMQFAAFVVDWKGLKFTTVTNARHFVLK